MKELTTYTRAISYVNRIYNLLNDEFFESVLSKPTITIQSTPKAYGHFTMREDTWVSKIGNTHEINIGAGTLARPIVEVVSTMLHEMVHYYNYVTGVRDCSRNNSYHNKRFRDAAESRGLVVNRSKTYGWAHTSPSNRIVDFVQRHNLTDIQINRNDHIKATSAKNSSTRKYVCPCCGISVRATKTIRIACVDCSKELELVKCDFSLPFNIIVVG